MTEQMQNLITALGTLVREDSRFTQLEQAIEEYERSQELNELIAEYNNQQNLLADTFGADELTRDVVQKRINTLYDAITNHPVYTAYADAKAEFDDLTTEIYGELQFAITGQRPCNGSCATCGSAGCAGCSGT